ncbi:MAG TPA: hypothetical protein VMF61_02640 [Candidatus Acidoferrales bacterium]|nr:hypothetical protein [Candidatus Acidoferrales bacterium]
MIATRFAGVFSAMACAVSLSACSDGGSVTAPQAPAAFRAVPQASPAYAIESFHFHVMRLRHGTNSAAAVPGGAIYPDDLTDYGGPIMKSEAAYNVYVNCPGRYASCWGSVAPFQQQLSGSAFAGLLTQYTKSPAASLTLSGSSAVTYKRYPGTALYENDLFSILHGVAAAQKQSGYGTLYHIFLPKGTDTCIDFSRQCYSPDYAPTDDFCAYHATVKYSDIGTIVYSVEPYQDVPGCKTDRSKGADELTNSTISTLAHETFESVTDPGPRLAWFNKIDGEELADECQYYVAKVTLGSTLYNIQPMYSNAVHACTTH